MSDPAAVWPSAAMRDHYFADAELPRAVKIGDTGEVIVTVPELMPEKSRPRLTSVSKVGCDVVLDGEPLVKVPREEKGKRPVMRL
jgi:hypothetical protein